MHARAAEFAELVTDRYGLHIRVEEFPEHGTPTAEDAAAAVDCAVDQIVKSLVFSVGDGPNERTVVCLTAGANRVSEAALAEAFDVDAETVTMATPDQVRETTGWAIGGVPPICHTTDAPTLFDPRLLDFEEVWAAAGTPSSVWAIDPERLHEVARAEVVDLTA